MSRVVDANHHVWAQPERYPWMAGEEMAPLRRRFGFAEVTEARWDAWRVEDLAPCVADALEWFGPERLLFGTDWPVRTLAAGHADVVRAYRETVAHLPADDRARIMGGTAARVYRLG